MLSNYTKRRIYPGILLMSLLMPFSSASALELDATLAWSKRVELSTPVSGVIEEVMARSGSRMVKGDTLLQLDQRKFKTGIKKAQSEVQRTRAIRDEAKREQQRAQELYDRTLLSDHELQTAKNAYIEATARYTQAQAGLSRATLEQEYSIVRCPFDAVIIRVLASEGQTINSALNTPVLVIIAEDGRMQARGVVSGTQLDSIKLEQAARVTVNGTSYKGRVRAIALEPLNNQDQYQLDVEFETGGKVLRAGLKAKLSL